MINKSFLLQAFLSASAFKILLFPAYRSTDFHVHRHWKAVTRTLPIHEWYYDNEHVDTVHTVDYPPSFLYMEYIWANNPLTEFLIQNGVIEPECLQLLSDDQVGDYNGIGGSIQLSQGCVAFLRSTVVLSDAGLWCGASVVAPTASSFFLLVANPAFLWIDHVHFQYNGILLGLLLASIGFLRRANEEESHRGHLIGAALFALVLTFKHLYLVLAPWYFVYLLRRYCTSWQNFGRLALAVGPVLLLPFVPFRSCLPRLLERMFPFGRGLVHDYWAGNVWAIFMAIKKVVPQLPEPSPLQVATLLLVALIPGLIGAWNAAARRDNNLLVLSLSYSGLAAFMFAYHVHEKAILTSLIPLTLIGGRWFRRMSVYGLLGLFPLLFLKTELLLKLVSYVGFIGWVYSLPEDKTTPSRVARWIDGLLGLPLIPAVAILILEMIPLSTWGRLEFLPLALTSLIVALGLISVYVEMLLEVLS